MGKKEENQNPYHIEYGLASNIGFVLRKTKKYDSFTIFLLVLGAIAAPFYKYLWTFMSKYIIDVITSDGTVKNLVTVMLAFAVAQLVITMVTTFVNNEIWWRFINVRMRVILLLNRKAMTVDFEHLENSDVMDCHRKAQNAVGGNQEGFEGMLHQMKSFLDSFTSVAAGIVILGTLNPLVVLLLVVLAGINFLLTNRANKKAKKEVWDKLATWWRKNDYIQNASSDFAAAKDIRMYGLRPWLLRKLREINRFRLDKQVLNEKIWATSSIPSNVVWAVSQAALYIWLIYSVIFKDLSIGNFTLYLASANSFFGSMSTLLNEISNFLARSREVDDFRSFLDFNGNLDEKDLPDMPRMDSYEFVFENVSFKYPKAEKYALKNLNLTIKAGERLAVVGLNGAGKSTMIKLLLRLYEPTEGRILLNGVDVRSYKKESYYEAFAPVFQTVEMFAFPLSQNVSMQEECDTDNQRAEETIRDAGLGDKLDTLDKGVETQMLKIIYDDGIDLSGGEKQKLALARALYKNSPVVVLDEPTAALDAIAEAKLYGDFDKLIGGKTSVYISHRLSSTRFCNAVAMFADGEMKEYGTHDELMAKNGAYAELFHVQAQYYVEEEGTLNV